MSQRFDAIVIGTGQAGPPLAGRLAAAGMSVAIIERKLFGGTCVNTGCTPTKTLVASAYAAHIARRGTEYGFAFDGPLRVDMARVQARAAAVSLKSRDSVEAWLRGMEHCTVFTGHARFVGPDAVSVGAATLTAPRIFIDVGGRASVPHMPAIGDVPFLSNSTLLERTQVPKHLVVVGGGYVGLEFAQAFRRFGAGVTVVEMGPRLIGSEDEDVSGAVREIIEAEGIAVRTGAQCMSLAPHAEGSCR
jgi:pyruvate/2-oxoglutarate dehydrogenase complex dihydrolipoamide dehydrogenase (E3) component